jgi:hypothetical protein
MEAMKTPPEIHTTSVVSMSQIAESPEPVRQAELNLESPYHQTKSLPSSPGKAVTYGRPAAQVQALATLDDQRIRNEIDMFDEKRCLDLRRSSNFNSFAASEVMDSRFLKEGSSPKRESPKRGNPYLNLR